MLHHSPTTSRHWATEQLMCSKLFVPRTKDSGLRDEMHSAIVGFMKKLTAATVGGPTSQRPPPSRPRKPALGGSRAGARGRASSWQVFAVTSLGAFVVSLDLSIVNVAFPAMAQAFRKEPRRAGVGDHRVLDRVRLAARGRRTQRRPQRSAPRVLRRAGDVHARLGVVRARAQRGAADRRARAAGRGRGRADPVRRWRS